MVEIYVEVVETDKETGTTGPEFYNINQMFEFNWQPTLYAGNKNEKTFLIHALN